jgi:hypothetical protein
VTPPLYTIDDALHALDYFGPDVGYDEAVLVTDGISARFMAGPVTPWSASPAWERTHTVDVVLACTSSVMAAPFGHRTYPLRFSDPTARGMTQRATQFSPRTCAHRGLGAQIRNVSCRVAWQLQSLGTLAGMKGDTGSLAGKVSCSASSWLALSFALRRDLSPGDSSHGFFCSPGWGRSLRSLLDMVTPAFGSMALATSLRCGR